MKKIKLFIDFWNFTLTMNRMTGPSFQTDWKTLPHVLARGAMHLVSQQSAWEFVGMHVYGSYDPHSPKDQDMHRWAYQTVARFPGVYVNFTPRQAMRNAPTCPACYKSVDLCPHCGASMLGTEEKSVDVSMATDMVRMAWDKAYDVAVLVSTDNDFVPVVEFLQIKGFTVVHGAFPPQGADLSQNCFATLDIPRLREEFRR